MKSKKACKDGSMGCICDLDKSIFFHESARFLLKHPDIDWVGSAPNFLAAHEEIMRHRPDTVLIEKETTSTGIPVDVIKMLEA